MRVQDRFIDDFDDSEGYDDIRSYNYRWTNALNKFHDENPREARRRNRRKNAELARSRRGKRQLWQSYEDEDIDEFSVIDGYFDTDCNERHHY